MKSLSVGYVGGTASNPDYGSVCLQREGEEAHSEAIKIEFDPRLTSYEELLEEWFKLHNPSVPSGKTQYQSAVFPTTDEQREVAESFLERKRAESPRPIFSEVRAGEGDARTKWWDAEWYHQNYNNKNKIRLAALVAYAALSLVPEGSFPMHLALRQAIFYGVAASMLPQLLGGWFDRILAVFD